MSNQPYSYVDAEAAGLSASKMIRKVYVWMTLALVITGLAAYYVASSPALLSWVFGSNAFIFLIIAELALVIGLSAAIQKLSPVVATLMFILYSLINGVTLSSIFIIYDIGSIANAFFVAAGTFAGMALYGSVTKKDLTKLGSLCIMALFGLLIAMLVNLFLHNSIFDMVICGVGVLIFVGLTAYDASKIKAMLYGVDEDEVSTKLAVLGALTLYLDFINIFLMLLRFFGRRN